MDWDTIYILIMIKQKETHSYYIKETTNTSHDHREIKTTRYIAQQIYQIWHQDMWITPEKGR